MYVEANNENIYTLLLDNKVIGNALISGGNTVEVFDWDGNLVRILNLDKKGIFVKVNKDNNKLYLFSINSETGEQNITLYNL
jgi:hypothetical protein